MLKIGITGQSGFIGTHLLNTLSLYKDEFDLVAFSDDFFESDEKLAQFVSKCDCIVHLAALNRHNDTDIIYNTNINLVKNLIASLEKSGSGAHIIFASSTQEESANAYGNSKREGRKLFEEWAQRNNALFTGLIIPNVFGPFGNPFYNSFIATFSHQLTHNQTPEIDVDSEVKLIYVSEVVQVILSCIRERKSHPAYIVNETSAKKVSEVLKFLISYKDNYFGKGIIPSLIDKFELNLFNTFRSYIEQKEFFPFRYEKHLDDRGSFVELVKAGTNGQVSYSTSKQGITRGNHFHTRKIERFAVIQGEAVVKMRKINTNEIFEFKLSGDEPSFVDMPIWYTHNITNTGSSELITLFWINEFYNPSDPDTFYEAV